MVFVWDAGVVYPFRVTYTVWLPTAMPVSVYGVTREVSDPSRKIRAPEGVDVTAIEPADVEEVTVKYAALVPEMDGLVVLLMRTW
jgi:hypothetical protein